MEDLARTLWSRSAQAWIDSVDEDASRIHLLDSRVDRLLGDVSGLRVLDAGCGEGRLCRRLAEKGAFCTGLDPTPELTERARSLAPDMEWRTQGAEDLEDVEKFDWVVFYLSLIDISQYEEAILRASRSLVPGGRMLIVNLNGFATCFPEAWERDEEGSRLYMKVDAYMTPRASLVAWKGIEILNYHRPLGSYLQALLRCGLELRWFEEAAPTPEEIQSHPSLAIHLRAPYFNIQIWQKPHH